MSGFRDGRLLFAGTLTDDNIEQVAEHLGTALNGKCFTRVTVSSGSGHRPEVRTGVCLSDEEGVKVKAFKDRRYIDLAEEDWTTSLWPDLSSQGLDIAVYERSVLVETHAPNGNHLWWSWTVESP